MKKLIGDLKKKYNLFAAYTLAFTIVCLGIFLPFIQEHKSFMWGADGLFQTFSSMVYISDYYKSILEGLLHGSFQPPMIDFSIGLGYDVFTTLNYYGLGDPLLLFSVFFKKENMYIFYDSLVILRLYLCGIAFMLYCAKMNKAKFQSLIGAILYVFCGFAIVAGERHPYFLNALIYLPLLLFGVENILKKKKSYLFTIMIFVSVVSNYYFFYMLTIMVFLYALIRFIDLYRIEWKKNIGNILIRGMIQYFSGVLLAGFAIVPTIHAFLNNARGTTGTYDSGFLYNKQYYVKMIYSFFSPPIDVNGNFTFLAYAPISFFIIIFLYIYKENRRKFIALKGGYALATIMLLTPIAGYIMNGMSYSSNRWIFGYSFLTAFSVVCLLDDLLKVSIKRLLPMAGISVILVTLFLAVASIRTRFSVWGVAYLILMMVVLIGLTKLKNKNIKYGAILIVSMLSVISFEYYQNSSVGYNYVKEFRENGQALNIIENCPQSSIDYKADESFYRIGSYGNQVENQSLTMGYNGTASYYSLVDGNILKYFKDMELTTIKQPHRFYGLDERTYLDALASVKYYSFDTESEQERVIPYGYEEVDRKIRENSEVMDVIYENQYVLPIGYTYDKKISTDYYDTLESIEKQQAMLQAVVVEDADNEYEDAMKYSEEQLDFAIGEADGITWDKEKGTIKIDEKKSSLTISFDAKKNCETYVRLAGLTIENANSSHLNAKITTNQSESTLYLTNSDYRWDLESENYLVNLGHNNDGITNCTITFSEPGEYKLDDIEVYSIPMTDYEKQITSLGEEALTNIAMTNNKITGNIDVSKDKILCFSVLYNTGWKLKIDGQETSLYKANTMYMATNITKGAHKVELTYQTPGIKVGIIISLAIFILLIGQLVISYIIANRNAK
ncbi:MAG: YfhO family protein [Lachnotalea sp.]